MIILKLIEQHGFQMFIDDEHVGNICPSGDKHEWAVYVLTASGNVAIPRISTTNDILDAIDDLEKETR
jgi:hypothetical protein